MKHLHAVLQFFYTEGVFSWVIVDIAKKRS